MPDLIQTFGLLFAQNGGAAAASPGPSWVGMVMPLVAIGFLFYFMLIRPERQKQRRHQELLDNIKKNDRVVTVGGIYGVVTNVQRDKDEVTLRVDETSNTKIPFTFAAIARVITQDSDGDKSPKS